MAKSQGGRNSAGEMTPAAQRRGMVKGGGVPSIGKSSNSSSSSSAAGGFCISLLVSLDSEPDGGFGFVEAEDIVESGSEDKE